MKSKSLIVQLMALLLVVLVVPSTFITGYNFYTTLAYAEEEIAKTAMEQIDSVSATNEMVLSNVVNSTLRVVQSGTFRQIRGMESYEELNDGYENIRKAMRLRVLFDELLINEESIHSAFFILEDSDYVVSSDKGVFKLDMYRNQEWLEDIVKDMNSLTGTWVPREMSVITEQQRQWGNKSDKKIPVISYVYTLKTLASSIKGTVVVNVYEEDIAEYLNPPLSDGNTEAMLIDSNGIVVSSPKDQDLKLFDSIKEASYYQQIIEENKDYGYVYDEQDGQRYLYAYRKSNIEDWMYLSRYNISGMVKEVNDNFYRSIIIMGIIILFGGILIFLITSRTLRPVKELVAAVKQDQQDSKRGSQNELQFIADAFGHMKAKESTLSNLLEKTENNSLRLAMRDALRGEKLNETNQSRIYQALPYAHIMVAYVGVDDWNKKDRVINEEEQKYNRLQINRAMERVLSEHNVQGIAVNHTGAISAVIMCFEQVDQSRTTIKIEEMFNEIQMKIHEQLDSTLTIGVSKVHSGDHAIFKCAMEADEAFKHKLLIGTGKMIHYNESMAKEDQFYYPYLHEERILNFVKMKQKEGLKEELGEIRQQMITRQDVSLDNVRFVYNLLAGAVMRYLLEKQINMFSIWKKEGYIYEQIAEAETIESIENAMYEFIMCVIEYLTSLEMGSDEDYTRQIVSYVETNYMNDIDFDQMSEEIGISYSYMRKIIKQSMGRSLLDTINIIRINKVKELMVKDDKMPLTEIAGLVGYANVQSLNRYFKKFEGIAPSKYRTIHIEK